MANSLTLTSIAENIFRARDQVVREICGFIPSVTVNSESDGVSINGTVNSLNTPAATLNTSYTPAMVVPATDDQTVTVSTMTLGQVASTNIPLTGENAKKLSNVGLYQAWLDQTIAQNIRAMVNAIESHCGTVIKNASSRATGTAGTTPFSSNHSAVNDLRKILVDNGATPSECSLIINTAAGVNLRNLSNLYKVNEAGTASLLNQGVLIDISGLKIRESAGVASHTKGTGTGYLINNGSGEIVGETTLTTDTGTGTIVAGDILTFAADTTNKYCVNTALASNDVVIGSPGLRIAAPNDNAITVGNSYTGNVAFQRNAVELAIRPPAQPFGGDSARDRMIVSDDKSGLVFEVALYNGFGMNAIYMTCFYQAKVWKPNFVATLLG